MAKYQTSVILTVNPRSGVVWMSHHINGQAIGHPIRYASWAEFQTGAYLPRLVPVFVHVSA